ncbi:MAG: hypothetical protein ACI4HI_15635 [Lachnospiraceae bacterium]
MIGTKKKLLQRIIGVIYILIGVGYFLGKKILLNYNLEYQYWIEILLRNIIWFVPLIMIGVFLFRVRKKTEKGRRAAFTVVFVTYCMVAVVLSFGYILFNAFTMSTDEKMQDGNLIVTVQNGSQTVYYYAEPVGVLFRRKITFDDARIAESLSKIYDAKFLCQKTDNGEVVFVSDLYPRIKVQMMREGYTKSTYLDNTLRYEITSQQLGKHRNFFDENNVQLVSYTYGKTKENPEGYGSCYAVLVTDENKEAAAKSICNFIRTTLCDDTRSDGKSCWNNLDGSIFLCTTDEETGEIKSLRNIPFSLDPDYSWILDENVTHAEVLEEIVNALK